MILDDTDSISDAQMAARLTRRSFNEAVRAVVKNLRQAHQAIWSKPGLDPQDVFDVIDTDGAAYVAANDALIAFISDMAIANGQTIDDFIAAADYSPPVDVSLTINGDDTITVVGP